MLAQSIAGFVNFDGGKFDIFKVRVSVNKNLKLKFVNLTSSLNRKTKAKYFEMIFGVLKLKFDEDKACSLSSQILTKSAKSARETSRSKANLQPYYLRSKSPLPRRRVEKLLYARMFAQEVFDRVGELARADAVIHLHLIKAHH